jgi:hypothetical protein|tara:strand:+ start:98 stop:682 length:585 start_codon:yes stop_codon:yes gene_type:complete
MKNKLKDKAFIEVDGHVLIKDIDTGEVLLDKHNAINYENMSMAIAGMLASGTATDYIARIDFGNGGSSIDSAGLIAYQTPNTSIKTGALYNKTMEKPLPTTAAANVGAAAITTTHVDTNVYTDIIVNATLDYGEPAGQGTIDTGTNLAGDYVFDELGLRTSAGNYLTHIIFHPIEKSSNRKIQVVYTIRIRAGA